MNNNLVSVVMPAYNCEKYIGQAIQSVLLQSVPFELIIIEDHSKDNTRKQIEPFLKDDRIICIYNETNMGVAASRNKGMELAKGKYIAFLDGDDCWTKDKLEKQTKLMEEKQAVLSSTGRALMDENGDLTGKKIGIKSEITYKELLKGNVLNTSGVMVLSSVAKKHPMVQDHLHEDYIMWLTILKEYDKAYGLDEPLLKYRIMSGTKSSNKFKSAKMTFGVYRYMGCSLFQSMYNFIWYAIKGVLKYI